MQTPMVPTVGRIVNYWRDKATKLGNDEPQPQAAIVTYVHKELTNLATGKYIVDLQLFPANTIGSQARSITMVTVASSDPENGPFAEWPTRV